MRDTRFTTSSQNHDRSIDFYVILFISHLIVVQLFSLPLEIP